MQTKVIVLIIVIGTLVSCQSDNYQSEWVEFKLPHIINTQLKDSLKSTPCQAEFITEVFPSFVGKFKFNDTIDINPKMKDSTFRYDYTDGYSQYRLNDSLSMTGFDLFVDYDNSVKYNPYYKHGSRLYDHYPVYFVNSTNTDKVFYGKDSHVFGIQEAVEIEPYPQWRPVEGRGFDFCGNGRWGIIVHPREFVLILMRRYEGDYETEMRVRFQIGENIFVSRPFIGHINHSQFSLRNGSYLEERLKETDGRAASWIFYGAVPKDEEWAVKAF